MNRKKQNKLDKILELPKEIYTNIPKITLTGFDEMVVENYKGIIEYGKECIRIQTKICRITFQGKGLEMVYYTNVDMKITGELESVCYS